MKIHWDILAWALLWVVLIGIATHLSHQPNPNLANRVLRQNKEK
jgi:hypothetical protein